MQNEAGPHHLSKLWVTCKKKVCYHMKFATTWALPWVGCTFFFMLHNVLHNIIMICPCYALLIPLLPLNPKSAQLQRDLPSIQDCVICSLFSTVRVKKVPVLLTYRLTFVPMHACIIPCQIDAMWCVVIVARGNAWGLLCLPSSL